MKSKGNSAHLKDLRKSMIVVSTVIVLFSVSMFAMVEFVSNRVFKGTYVYTPIDALGMIIPMGILAVVVSYTSIKRSSRYFTRLIAAIAQIAEGNFDVTLNVDDAGSFKNVFIDFNKMSRELKGVQTLRDDFINLFSHEFKTPIMSINGFASLMLEKEVSIEDQKKYLRIIANESKRLAELSNNTLLLAKLDSQQIVLDKQDYSLDEQLKECLILLAPQWTEKKLDVSAELQPVIYHGNKEIMTHLWLNILSNAIKFTPQNGDIRITLTKKDEERHITIEDNGKGMTEDELSQIFNRYYKGDDKTTSKGLGLGLSIAKQITELCQGEILVSSEPNRGSVVTVVIS